MEYNVKRGLNIFTKMIIAFLNQNYYREGLFSGTDVDDEHCAGYFVGESLFLTIVKKGEKKKFEFKSCVKLPKPLLEDLRHMLIFCGFESVEK